MFPRTLTSKWLYHLVRWFLALLFVAAGLLKLPATREFAETIADFGIVLDGAVFPLALVIPLLEIAAGAGIALDIRGSLTALTGLLVVFCGALVYGIWLGLDIDCGCFELGTSRRSSTGLVAALGRDAVLLVCCWYLFWWRWHHGLRPKSATIVAGSWLTEGGHKE